jgi:hypothetical protein
MNKLSTLLIILAFAGCGSVDPKTVNQQANAGSELMKRCQTSIQKISSQCNSGSSTNNDCQTNVQEVKNDCMGAQGIFDTLIQVTADSNK